MKTLSLPTVRAVLIGVALLGACAPRHTPPGLLAPDVQFERGIEAFEAGRHARAIEFLQPFALQHVGDPRLPDALYMLGRAYTARREFVSAANEFQRLASEFPTHPNARAARLGTCEAYVSLAPRPQLDQEYTYAALNHCDAVAATFPGTAEAEQARQRVVEMRHRLAQKEYETGLFYFRRRAFDASVIYFQRAADEYPDTQVAPSALLRLHEAYTRIGYVEEAQEVRDRLLRDYPQSAEAQGLRA
jgi:outer membrane protein assembly factor BamD